METVPTLLCDVCGVKTTSLHHVKQGEYEFYACSDCFDVSKEITAQQPREPDRASRVRTGWLGNINGPVADPDTY